MLLRSRIAARLAAAVVLTAAALAVAPASPAGAATCASADGVSVVVDFHELGGGVRTVCLPDGGGQRASSLFPAAGFPLSFVQRTPGFVCRVSGAPADNPCVNTPPSDAYWGLWWSDGESGSWNYATSGASGLTVPDGGYVAFSWNGTSTRSAPGVTPAPHPSATPTSQPTSKPTSKPTAKPTSKPSASGSSDSGKAPIGTTGDTSPTSSASPSASQSASTKPDQKSDKKKSKTTDPSPSTDDSDPAEPTDDEADPAAPVPASAEAPDPDSGMPGWVAPAVIVVLFGAVGGVAVLRRRGSTTP